MNREMAAEVITRYFNSWIDKDFETFKHVLHVHVDRVKQCTLLFE